MKIIFNSYGKFYINFNIDWYLFRYKMCWNLWYDFCILIWSWIKIINLLLMNIENIDNNKMLNIFF